MKGIYMFGERGILLADVKKVLETYGYTTLRERANIYEGIILGTLIPTAICRYALIQNKEGGIVSEAMSWGLALLFSLPLQPITLSIGTYLGIYSAQQLRNKRFERESKLKSLVE